MLVIDNTTFLKVGQAHFCQETDSGPSRLSLI